MIWLLDNAQLAVLSTVKRRLYNERIQMTADERRDLANMMDAVLSKVESFGPIDDGYELVKKGETK